MNSLPRRYVVNDDGHQVLVGLTPQETLKFEALDGLPALGTNGELPTWESDAKTGGGQRWRELYAKHESAWQKWMADQEDVHLNWLMRPRLTGDFEPGS